MSTSELTPALFGTALTLAGSLRALCHLPSPIPEPSASQRALVQLTQDCLRNKRTWKVLCHYSLAMQTLILFNKTSSSSNKTSLVIPQLPWSHMALHYFASSLFLLSCVWLCVYVAD